MAVYAQGKIPSLTNYRSRTKYKMFAASENFPHIFFVSAPVTLIETLLFFNLTQNKCPAFQSSLNFALCKESGPCCKNQALQSQCKKVDQMRYFSMPAVLGTDLPNIRNQRCRDYERQPLAWAGIAGSGYARQRHWMTGRCIPARTPTSVSPCHR